MFLPVSTEDDWKITANNFSPFWKFPNCGRSVDGKHITMQAPRKSGLEYFNYKGTHSIVLMAISDARYKLGLIDVGCSGIHSDGGVPANSAIGKVMKKQQMNFPGPECLPGTQVKLPHVIVADEAFPLRENIMCPFPGHNLPEQRSIFN